MAWTGFDPDVVSSSINAVITAYNDLYAAMGTEMQNSFVNGMANVWACNAAQAYFNQSFAPRIDGIIRGSNETFVSIVDSMNSAARAWAEVTDSSYSDISFTPNDKYMDVSCILENVAGVRGIDADAAQGILAKLPIIANNALNALTSASSAVDNCGFIGGDQAASLKASLENIKGAINSAVEDLTNDAKRYIDETVNAYGDLGNRIAQAFAGE